MPLNKSYSTTRNERGHNLPYQGNLNLISRQLGALPGALFQIHLGVDPKPLAGQSPSSPTKEMSSAGNRWEAVDLTVLKAGDNEIVELQVGTSDGV